MAQITDPAERRIFAFDGDSDEVLAKRDNLRESIKQHPYCTCRDYKPSYGGRDKEGKPYVTNLHDLEAMVLRDLYEAVCFEFPETPRAPTALEQERGLHRFFVQDLASTFQCRNAALKRLTEHLEGHPDAESLPLVVIGPSGRGKSSLLSAFVNPFVVASAQRPAALAPTDVAQQQRRWVVLTHMIGASPTSTDIVAMLWRLCEEMAIMVDMVEFRRDAAASYAGLREEFLRMLKVTLCLVVCFVLAPHSSPHSLLLFPGCGSTLGPHKSPAGAGAGWYGPAQGRLRRSQAGLAAGACPARREDLCQYRRWRE